MELRHLRYFVAAAEEQNITRAAARLHVSQPPLSRQIHDLEEELGVSLFDRRAQSIRLTDAGRLFLVEARAVLQRTDDAVRAVQSLTGKGRGEIHVGYAPSLTVEILPRALRAFQLAAPGTKVTLHDLSSGEMLDQVRNGRIHLALGINSGPKEMRGLHFTNIQRYAVSVAVPVNHPLARKRGITLQDLATERLIAYTREDYPEYHRWLLELFAAIKPKPVIAEENDSATSLIAAIEAGRGVALVPECMACLAGPRLKIRPIHPAPAPFFVGAITHPGKSENPLTRQFLEAASNPVSK